jgi:isoquinoline 1-oxidoreductase subunit beta
MGATEFPQRFVPNYALHSSVQPLGMRTGALRAPSSNAIAFVIHSFIDELAHAAGKDPSSSGWICSIRLPRPAGSGGRGFGAPGVNAERMKGVLQAGGREIRLGQEDAAQGHRHGRGVSISAIRDISPKWPKSRSSPPIKVKVNKVWVAADVGSQIVNPSAADNIVPGRHHRRHERVDEPEDHGGKGRVVQTNYHQHG